MKEYIGTKIVKAEPAIRYLMKDGSNRVVAKSDQLAMEQVDMNEVVGYEEAYVVVYKDGYSSWSPKKVFEEAYRETSGMTKIDRILRGDKDTLVNEICDIVKWAREMSKQDWYNITHDADGGLRGVIRRIVEKNLSSSGTDEAAANKIYDICIQVAQITRAEVEELREIARGQREYNHPLMMATTKKQNELGEHNDAVVDALLNLKAVIESGAHLAE